MKKLPLVATAALLIIGGIALINGRQTKDPQPRYIPEQKTIRSVDWNERVVLGQDYAITLSRPTSAAAIYGTNSELVWYQMDAVVEIVGTKNITYIPISAQDGNGDSIEVIGLIENTLTPGQIRRTTVTIKSHGTIDNYLKLLLFDSANQYTWTYQL